MLGISGRGVRGGTKGDGPDIRALSQREVPVKERLTVHPEVVIVNSRGLFIKRCRFHPYVLVFSSPGDSEVSKANCPGHCKGTVENSTRKLAGVPSCSTHRTVKHCDFSGFDALSLCVRQYQDRI